MTIDQARDQYLAAVRQSCKTVRQVRAEHRAVTLALEAVASRLPAHDGSPREREDHESEMGLR
jgi:hypothetical protein